MLKCKYHPQHKASFVYVRDDGIDLLCLTCVSNMEKKDEQYIDIYTSSNQKKEVESSIQIYRLYIYTYIQTHFLSHIYTIQIDYILFMKCVYTSSEIDMLLAELQQDKTFILSNFFALAVKDYYSKKVKKITDVGDRLEKAKVNLQVAEQTFNEVNKEAIVVASQKAQEDIDRKKEESEERERWTIYAKKALASRKFEVDMKIITDWVNIVLKEGAENCFSIVEYYNKYKEVQK